MNTRNTDKLSDSQFWAAVQRRTGMSLRAIVVVIFGAGVLWSSLKYTIQDHKNRIGKMEQQIERLEEIWK